MQAGRVLLVDGHSSGSFSQDLENLLRPHVAQVRCARANLEAAVNGDLEPFDEVIAQTLPDAVFLCLCEESMPLGPSLLKATRQVHPGAPMIAVVDTPDSELISRLLAQGVADFMMPPLRPAELLARLRRWLHKPSVPAENDADLQAQLARQGLLGQCKSFLLEMAKLPKIAAAPNDVMILGETGTGKELCARALHELSPRRHKPFNPVNSGAIPVELMENELFGHVAGAYTGATAAAGGLVQASKGGTLFLDEIHALPMVAQVKLMRFLQEREFRPVGATKATPIDVRVITASNLQLRHAVETGAFREDLFYRLNKLELTLPPLREREGDIELLAREFLAKYAEEHKKCVRELSSAALQRLVMHSWPGNVRELQNVMHRAVLGATSPRLEARDILLPETEVTSFKAKRDEESARSEIRLLKMYMQQSKGNISEAARLARIDRHAFRKKLQKHKLLC